MDAVTPAAEVYVRSPERQFDVFIRQLYRNKKVLTPLQSTLYHADSHSENCLQ